MPWSGNRSGSNPQFLCRGSSWWWQVQLSCVRLSLTKHQSFHEEKVCEYVLNFLHSNKPCVMGKNTSFGSTSSSCVDQRNQLNKSFSQPDHNLSKHKLSLHNFVVLHADFLGDVWSLASKSSKVSYVSTVHFLPGFLFSNDPAVFSLLTR